MKGNKAVRPILYAALIAVGMLLGRYISNGTYKRTPEASKVNHVLRLVQEQYVDSINPGDLQEKVVQSVLTSLDPHSYYIPAEEVEQVNRDLVGSFVGIGVEFNVINDTPYLVRIMRKGPAEQAGLRPADRMVSADGNELVGLNNEEIIKILKGNMNSTVSLSIRRPHEKEMLSFDITRNTVPIPSVSASFMLDSLTAYIKVDRFANKTGEEFENRLRKLKKTNKVERIVVDLRNNPGGYLHTAVEMLDEFFDDKKLLAYTKGKASNKKEFYSSAGGMATNMEVICLVNRYSASASEIFSGAIQDYDRGLVIGEKTFGKGLVQETFELPDLSQLRLTVSRYYIPSGRCIQKSYGDDIHNYYDEVNHRKDTQLGEHDTFYFETASGRKVFGGGGIDPDVVVSNGKDHQYWLKTKEFNQTLRDFIDQEYAQILEAKSGSELFANSTVETKASASVKTDSGQNSEDLLLPIVRRFYGDQAYFIEYTKRDSTVMKSLEQFDRMNALLGLK